MQKAWTQASCGCTTSRFPLHLLNPVPLEEGGLAMADLKAISGQRDIMMGYLRTVSSCERGAAVLKHEEMLRMIVAVEKHHVVYHKI